MSLKFDSKMTMENVVERYVIPTTQKPAHFFNSRTKSPMIPVFRRHCLPINRTPKPGLAPGKWRGFGFPYGGGPFSMGEFRIAVTSAKPSFCG